MEAKAKEWSASIRAPKDLNALRQLGIGDESSPFYPYDETGIRYIGSTFKDDEERTAIQAVRFSNDKIYGWDEEKIKSWMQENSYEIKSLVEKDAKKLKIQPRTIEYDFSVRSDFDLVTKKAKYTPGEDLIIEGIINSDSVDTYDEIVDPDAVMESKGFYMKFPTVRFMHEPEPIGKTLDIWKEGNNVRAKVKIHGTEVKIIQKILDGVLKAFSIGFKVLKMEQFCESEKKCYWKYTKIRLVEISVVDSPANRDAKYEEVYYKKAISNEWIKPEHKGKMVMKSIDLGEIYDEEPEIVDCKEKQEPKSVGVNIVKKSLYNQLRVKHLTKCDSILNEIRGIEMSEEDTAGQEPTGEVTTEPVEQEPVTPEKIVPEATEEPDPVGEKMDAILDGIKNLTSTVKSNSKELERMKMSEEERKADEELEKKVADAMKAKEAEIVAIKEEKEKMANDLTALKALYDNLPLTKKSLDPSGADDEEKEEEDDVYGSNVTKKEAKAYQQVEDILLKYCNTQGI